MFRAGSSQDASCKKCRAEESSAPHGGRVDEVEVRLDGNKLGD